MWGKVTAIAVYVYGHVAVAGGKDGGLAIWDLDENPDYHKAYQDQTIRTATVDTGTLLNTTENKMRKCINLKIRFIAMLEHSQHETIIGLQVVQQTEDNSLVSQ